jgi:hypothetical protein
MGSRDQLDGLIKDLKSHHFKAGNENGAKHPTNTLYGGFG